MKYAALIVSGTLVLSLASRFASADEPSLSAWVTQRVQSALLKPLANFESERFSRVRPPPRERRIRILQTAATADKNGKTFVPFAIDVRFGDEWSENDIVGCAYTPSGNLFVKRGDAYRPASFLLGKNAAPVPNVCEPAPAP